jgi:hypothetical protein
LILDERLVADQAATSQVVFADPGTHKLTAGWKSAPSETKVFEATAGGTQPLSFQAADEPAPAIHIKAGADAPSERQAETQEAQPSSNGLSPVFFLVGAGATVVVGGIAVWSGIDTKNNPGPDTVRKNCVGLGADCPEYQEGISKERRTNYLWIGTAGAAVVTGVLAVFTDWGSRGKRTSQGAVQPTLGYRDGLTLGAVGRF